MRPLLALSVSTLVYLLSAGCDGLEVAPKQIGEPCTRDYQCATGLCFGGECAVPSDAAVDAAADAAVDAAAGG